MMRSFILIILSVFALLFFYTGATLFPDEFVSTINRGQPSWIAGRLSDRRAKQLLQSMSRVEHPDEGEEFSYTEPEEFKGSIPKVFDARKKWPKCKIMGNVPNQGSCGNNWAVAMTDTLSKRLCAQSDGEYDFQFSADDLTRCCSVYNNQCAIYEHGCYGGYTRHAYRYWLDNGIVSGNNYKSNKGCRPYSKELYKYFDWYGTTLVGEHKNMTYEGIFHYYEWYGQDLEGETPTSLKCFKRCSNSAYKKKYQKDKMFGKKVNYLHLKHPIHIQREIIANGPVQAEMEVFPDFYTYVDGVYYHVQLEGYEISTWHSVVIIGWGRHLGIDYWLAINTWGSKWGKKGGEFKIRRGNNECQIESSVYAPYFNISRVRNKAKAKDKSACSTIPKIQFANLIILETFIMLVLYLMSPNK